MKHPSTWNKSDLNYHLQHALNLEFWTIPLYLTALYSIKGLKGLKHIDFPDAAKLIFSVVIQEMLHMELVCNLTNALGFSPKFELPNYDERKGIPYIHPPKEYLPPELQGYHVKPSGLNEESLCLFCVIEMPHPQKAITWENEKSYDSIAELYEALRIGISTLWNEYYVGDEKNTKQKNTFKEYHNTDGKEHGFSQIVNSPETARKAIEAIIEQGEGADSKNVPVDFRPHHLKESKDFATSWYKGYLSHYQKFRLLLHSQDKWPEVYEENNDGKDLALQENFRKIFLDFLHEMQTNFNNDGEAMSHTFWSKMAGLGDAIASVWEAGMCPDFNFDIVD